MTEVHRSPLALTLLALLFAGPVHPYQMQVRLKEWGKDLVVNVDQRTAVYRTIERLAAGGLIEIERTERESQHPERTLYSITDAGRTTARRWLGEMLATPAREFPELPAALSNLPLLSPDEASEHLEVRLEALRAQVAALDDGVEQAATMGVPRLFLVECELIRTLNVAEIDFVVALVGDLRSRRLTWDERWLGSLSTSGGPGVTG